MHDGNVTGAASCAEAAKPRRIRPYSHSATDSRRISEAGMRMIK